MNDANIIKESLDYQAFIPPSVTEQQRPEFFRLNQFVTWKPIPKENGKVDKLPWDFVNDRPLRHRDRSTWLSYDEAVRSGRPIGFVFSADCGFAPVDLDACFDPTTQQYTRPEAVALLSELNSLAGVAWEFSQSGKGLHIVGRADTLLTANLAHKADGWREQYAGSHRFIAFGRHGWQGSGTANLTTFLRKHWPQQTRIDCDPSLTSTPSEGWDGYVDDDELLAAFRRSQSSAQAFGDAATNAALLDADVSVLARAFPSATDDFDRSSADLALANRLAWWTGNHGERMVRLMRRSALARKKWDERRGDGSYLTMTVARAVTENTRGVMNRSAFKEQRRAEQIERMRRVGDGEAAAQLFTPIMNLDEMLEQLIFVGSGSGGIIERNTHRIRMLSTASVEYGASFSTVPDKKTGEPIEKPTFPIWKSHPDRKRVDHLTWWPGKPTFCEPPEKVGEIGYNLWKPLEPPCAVPNNWQEYVHHFNEHIEYLVPDATERHLFVQWLAHIFQRPGELPHTYYIMIAENQGIGRNLLAAWLTDALRGHVAAGINLAETLDSQFNGRLSQKILCIVDEIRADSSAAGRYRHEDRLKAFITERFRHINPKFGVQSVEVNAARWLMFSNHADAIPVSHEDRRAVVIKNPTTIRDEAYYAQKYQFVDDPLFAASVWYFLTNVVSLEGFNPGRRAPLNEAKLEMLENLKSETDRRIEDVIEECDSPLALRSMFRSYFYGEKISDSHLTHALRRAGVITTTRRIRAFNRRDTICILPPKAGVLSITAGELEHLSNDAILRLLPQTPPGIL